MHHAPFRQFIGRIATPVWLACAALASAQGDSSLQAPAAREIVQALEANRVAVFEKSAPAVVILEVELLQDSVELDAEAIDPNASPKRPSRADVRKPIRSEGSGFIVRSNGVIATNFHVVNQARRITVRLRDGRRIEGRVLGADERTDIAIVKVEAENLPFLEFANSDSAKIGQFVYAIGVPFGQEWSFTSGMLSGKGRSRLLGPASSVPLFEDYLQTDAFINPGHSGGPLLNCEGRVLGMNTLIARAERGLAFAVPSNLLVQTIQQIVEAGKVSRPWLGIRVETLGDSAALQERLGAAKTGVIVLAVEADGPAFRTDLRPADVIQTVNEKNVASALELQRELFERKAGTQVTLGVWRQGVVKNIPVKLAELPEAPRPVPELEKNAPAYAAGPEKFGLTLREIKGRGVRVEAIAGDSAAAHSDLQEHDIITEVEWRQVRSAADCIAAIKLAEGRNSGGALLQVERQGRRTFVLWRGN